MNSVGYDTRIIDNLKNSAKTIILKPFAINLRALLPMILENLIRIPGMTRFEHSGINNCSHEKKREAAVFEEKLQTSQIFCKQSNLCLNLFENIYTIKN